MMLIDLMIKDFQLISETECDYSQFIAGHISCLLFLSHINNGLHKTLFMCIHNGVLCCCIAVKGCWCYYQHAAVTQQFSKTHAMFPV